MTDSSRSHQEETPEANDIDVLLGKAYRAVLDNRWGDAQMLIANIQYQRSLAPSGEPGGAVTDTARLDWLEGDGNTWIVPGDACWLVRTAHEGADSEQSYPTLRDAIDAAMAAARLHQGEPK